MLNVEKLAEDEAVAAGRDDSENLVEGLRAELTAQPEDDPDADTDTDSDPPADEPPEDGESEPGDVPVEGEELLAEEAMAMVRVDRITMEDATAVKELAGSALTALGAGLSYLGHLGLRYGPTVLRGAYKGVLYAAGRLAKLTYLSFVTIDRFVERQSLATTKLRREIESYREAISLLRESGKQIRDAEFADDTLIAALATGGTVDWAGGVKTTQDLMQGVVLHSAKALLTEIGSIGRLIREYNPKTYQPDTEAVMVRPPKGLTERSEVTVNEDLAYLVFKYPTLLPGNRVVEWRMPKTIKGATDVQDISYGVGVRTDAPSVDKAPKYMSVDALSGFLDSLESLCDSLDEQQKLYKLIKDRKSALRVGFKLYFNQLFLSAKPVHIGQSMLDVVYMRSVMVDRVYLVGMMDMHDMVSRIVRDNLHVVKRHIRNYE